MPVPYRKRKEYFRQYYQKSKGVKSVKKGVKINTRKQPRYLTPNLTPEKCLKCRTLETITQAYENLQKEVENLRKQKPQPTQDLREYWRQQKRKQYEKKKAAKQTG